MNTIERQFEGLYELVGSGVIDGWEVTTMPSTLRGETVDYTERESLINASDESLNGRWYASIGSPGLHDEAVWAQIVKVSSGRGVIDKFASKTITTSYFRVVNTGYYYIWAEPSPCLADNGLAIITMPNDQDSDRDAIFQITYLATVHVNVVSNESIITEIEYEDRRRDLIGLRAQLEEALKTYFYSHKHTGLPGMPSKINLTTKKILTASGPYGSPIFKTYDNDVHFTWNASDYGTSNVYIGDQHLSESQYTLEPSTGRVMFETYPGDGLITVALDLATNIQLKAKLNEDIESSIYSANPAKQRHISLVLKTDASNEDASVYTWSDDNVSKVLVYLQDVLVNSKLYQVNAGLGGISFKPALSASNYSLDDLKVMLVGLHDEVQDKLDYSRLDHIDASSFTHGKLPDSSIGNISHIGEYRIDEVLTPVLQKRLFRGSDDDRFYPEIPNSPIQIFTSANWIGKSVNLASGKLLASTPRGFCYKDVVGFVKFDNWSNDNGNVNVYVDNILPDTPYTNVIKDGYAYISPSTTHKAYVYRVTNGGNTWHKMRTPINENETNIEINWLAASTDKKQTISNLGLISYEYSTFLYLATNSGTWMAFIPQGANDADWAWSKIRDIPDQVNQVAEAGTLHKQTSVDSFGVSNTEETYERTLYSATQDGLFVEGIQYDNLDVQGCSLAHSGTLKHQLAWWTSSSVHVSLDAEQVTITSSGNTNQYWNRALTTNRQSLAACRVASATQYSSGLTTIDGVSIVNGNRVLVFDDSAGIQIASSGNWHYSDIDHGVYAVDVTAGNTYANTKWELNITDSGATAKPIALSVPISDVVNCFWDSNNDQVIVLTNTDVFALIPKLDGTHSLQDLNWDHSWLTPTVGFADSTGIYVSSEIGMRCLTPDSTSWTRLDVPLAPGSLFILANETDIYDSAQYEIDYIDQSLTVNDSTRSSKLIYDTSHKIFTGKPWNSSDATELVKVDGLLTNVPNILYPELGKIEFLQDLDSASTVTLSVLRNGTNITDIGTIPHEETWIGDAYTDTSITYLTKAIDPSAPSGARVVLREPLSLGNQTQIIEFRYQGYRETAQIALDNDGWYLVYNRSSDVLLPKNTTVATTIDSRRLGIEDEIAILNSNQTYHMEGVTASNILKLIEQRTLSGFSGNIANDEVDHRGFVNVFQFNDDNLDVDQSVVGQIVAEYDESRTRSNNEAICVAEEVNGVLYGIGPTSLWRYDGNTWSRMASRGSTAYPRSFISSDNIIASSVGVEQISGSEIKSIDRYTNDIRWIEKTDWNEKPAMIYAGLMGVTVEILDGSISSDSSIALRGKRCWHTLTQKLKIVDPTGNATTPTICFVSNDDGLSALMDGENKDEYGSFIATADVLGSTLPTIIKHTLEGDVSQKLRCISTVIVAPIPVYPPPQTESASYLMVLTEAGIYRINNWQSVDFTKGTSSWSITGPYLENLSCYAAINVTTPASDGIAGQSILLVATDQGMYRSYDLGLTYHRSQSIPGNGQVLSMVDTTNGIVACTSRGIYTTKNHGDDWDNGYLGSGVYPEESKRVYDQNTIYRATIDEDIDLIKLIVQLSGEQASYRLKICTLDAQGVVISTLFTTPILSSNERNEQIIIPINASVFANDKIGLQFEIFSGKLWQIYNDNEPCIAFESSNLALPQLIAVPIDLQELDGNGLIYHDDDSVSMAELNFVTFGIDDTGSSGDDRGGTDRANGIQNLLLSIHNNNLNTFGTLGSVITIDSTVTNRSHNITNDLSDLSTQIAAWKAKGSFSYFSKLVQICAQNTSPANIEEFINANKLGQDIVNQMHQSGYLRLADIQQYYDQLPLVDKTDWNGTWDTIKNHGEVMTYCVQRFARLYKAYIYVFSDGDDIDYDSEAGEEISEAWNNQPCDKMLILSKSNSNHLYARNIVDNTDDVSYFAWDANWIDLANYVRTNDYSDTIASFEWSTDSPIWTDSITFVKEVQSGNSLGIEAQISVDGYSFGQWRTVSGTQLTINNFVRKIKFRFTFHKQSGAYSPILKSITINAYAPAKHRWIYNGIQCNTAIKYIVDHDNPYWDRQAILTRDDKFFESHDTLRNHRLGALFNRNFGHTIIPKREFGPYNTHTTDGVAYQVVNELVQNISWKSTDIIRVFVGNVEIASVAGTYSTDWQRGIIRFVNQQPLDLVVKIIIVRPSSSIKVRGEMAHFDGLNTWQLDSHRIPKLSTYRAYINDEANTQVNVLLSAGMIISGIPMNADDVCSVLCEYDSNRHLLIADVIYQPTIDIAPNGAVMFDSLSQQHYSADIDNPSLTADPTLKRVGNHVYLNYAYVNTGGVPEGDTITHWYRKQPGDIDFMLIAPINGFDGPVDYENRVSIRIDDLNDLMFNTGDLIKVTIQPASTLTIGATYTSNTITLSTTHG